MKKKKKLIRQQLDKTLSKFSSLSDISMPSKGWIRAIRDALGMNGRQLADRLGVTRQRAALLEKDEITGSTSLKTMRKIAECLDCVFVYTLIPRASLEQTIREQASKVAQKRLSRAAHTMRLEDQGLNSDEQNRALSDMIEELINEPPATFWD